MKKYAWFIAALTALALVFSACGGSTADPPKKKTGGDETAEGLYLATTEGGTAVSGGGKSYTTTTTNQNLYVYFDAPGRNFEKLVFDFTLDPGANFTITALYGRSGGDTCTWGKQTWDTDYYEGGPLDILTTDFAADWSGTGDAGIIKSSMFGFCVSIAAANTTFTVKSVTFVGLEAAADKTELIQLIADSEEFLDPADWTTESWAAFSAKLSAARAIRDKNNATPQEVADAIAALYEAYEALVPAVTVDKTALNTLIAEVVALNLNEADYTPGTWSIFDSALNHAIAVAAAGNSLQRDVDAAIQELTNARDGLAELDPVVSAVIFEDGDWAQGINATFSKGAIVNAGIPIEADDTIYVDFTQPIDISGYGAIIVEFDGEGGRSFIVSMDMTDSQRSQFANWWSNSPMTLDFVGDFQDWGGTPVSETNGLLGGLEIYHNNTDGETISVTKIYFEGAQTQGGGGTVEADNWYLSTTENGGAAPGNTTAVNDGYVYVYFNSLATCTGVILTFETAGGITLTKQGVYDATGMWGWGWGDVISGIQLDLSGATSWGASGYALDLATLSGICIAITGTGSFTLTKVELVQ